MAFYRWAISGGFAHVNDNGVIDINVVDAVPLKEIDPEKLARAIEEAKQKLNDQDPVIRAQAEIALELFEPIDAALKANV